MKCKPHRWFIREAIKINSSKYVQFRQCAMCQEMASEVLYRYVAHGPSNRTLQEGEDFVFN